MWIVWKKKTIIGRWSKLLCSPHLPYTETGLVFVWFVFFEKSVSHITDVDELIIGIDFHAIGHEREPMIIYLFVTTTRKKWQKKKEMGLCKRGERMPSRSTHCTGGSFRRSRPASSSPRTCTRRSRRATRSLWSASSAPCTTARPARTRPCTWRCRATSDRCPGSSSAGTWDAPPCNTPTSRCSPAARRPTDAVSTASAELETRQTD